MKQLRLIMPAIQQQAAHTHYGELMTVHNRQISVHNQQNSTSKL